MFQRLFTLRRARLQTGSIAARLTAAVARRPSVLPHTVSYASLATRLRCETARNEQKRRRSLAARFSTLRDGDHDLVSSLIHTRYDVHDAVDEDDVDLVLPRDDEEDEASVMKRLGRSLWLESRRSSALGRHADTLSKYRFRSPEHARLFVAALRGVRDVEARFGPKSRRGVKLRAFIDAVEDGQVTEMRHRFEQLVARSGDEVMREHLPDLFNMAMVAHSAQKRGHGVRSMKELADRMMKRKVPLNLRSYQILLTQLGRSSADVDARFKLYSHMEKTKMAEPDVMLMTVMMQLVDNPEHIMSIFRDMVHRRLRPDVHALIRFVHVMDAANPGHELVQWARRQLRTMMTLLVDALEDQVDDLLEKRAVDEATAKSSSISSSKNNNSSDDDEGIHIDDAILAMRMARTLGDVPMGRRIYSIVADSGSDNNDNGESKNKNKKSMVIGGDKSQTRLTKLYMNLLAERQDAEAKQDVDALWSNLVGSVDPDREQLTALHPDVLQVAITILGRHEQLDTMRVAYSVLRDKLASMDAAGELSESDYKERVEDAMCSMIEAYSATGRKHLVQKTYWEMVQQERIRPTSARAFVAMIDMYSKTGNVTQMLRTLKKMKELGWPPHLRVYNMLIRGFSRGTYVAGERRTDPARAEYDAFEACWVTFKELKAAGVRPNEHTYQAMIDAAGFAYELTKLEQLWDEAQASSLLLSVNTHCSLVEAHCRCGFILRAIQDLERLQNEAKLPLTKKTVATFLSFTLTHPHTKSFAARAHALMYHMHLPISTKGPDDKWPRFQLQRKDSIFKRRLRHDTLSQPVEAKFKQLLRDMKEKLEADEDHRRRFPYRGQLVQEFDKSRHRFHGRGRSHARPPKHIPTF